MRIKELLKQKGLTAKDLATMAGLTEPFLSKVMNGKSSPTLQTLQKIADALHISIAELFTDEVSSNKLVAFIHYNGTGHTPTTIDQIMAVLKNWDEDEFHRVCHSITFNHIRDTYEGNTAVEESIDSLCALLREHSYQYHECLNKPS